MIMQNEELFDSSSSIFDILPDTESNSETDSLIGSPYLVRGEIESHQGSDGSAVTPIDNSSCYTVIVDQREVIEEMQRIEGYTISILYMLYIGLALVLGIIIVKMIYHFTKFN